MCVSYPQDPNSMCTACPQTCGPSQSGQPGPARRPAGGIRPDTGRARGPGIPAGLICATGLMPGRGPLKAPVRSRLGPGPWRPVRPTVRP